MGPANRQETRPDTRARVEARRRLRKGQQGERARVAAVRPSPAPSSPSSTSPSAAQKPATDAGLFPLNQPIRNPLLKKQARTIRKRPGPSAAAGTRQQAQVKPGPRRVLLAWLKTGQLLSLVLFLGTIGTIAYLFISPQFTIQQVDIEGNTILPNNTIANLANIEDTSIWFVNRNAIAYQVQQNPYIERVGVGVALPNRVVLQVVERQPDVYWKQGPFYYLVDHEGNVLEQGEPPQSPDTLVVVDTTGVVREPGDQVDPDALRLAHALAFRLPSELDLTPAFIGWDFAIGVYIRLTGGQTVIFGQYDNLERKLQVLHFLLNEGTPFTYLDLRPSTPFYQNNEHQLSGSES